MAFNRVASVGETKPTSSLQAVSSVDSGLLSPEGGHSGRPLLRPGKDQLEDLHNHVLATSPVGNTLANPAQIEVRLVI